MRRLAVRRLAVLFALLLAAPLAQAQPLQTVAEKTDYKATSLYADVVAFCEAIAKRGPVAKLDDFGTSHEGRKLPLLVISDPPVTSAEEAKKAGKLVVLAFANIHAGEVDGKEALLALARDLTDKKGHPLLKDLVILLVPILNADGNEKINPRNRPRENGPTDGAGTRENAQGLDLNRDFVKLESPEIRALIKLVNTWNPALIIDCHTTNGSRHRHALTYDGPRYPSTEATIPTWANSKLFPAVEARVKELTGFDLAPYGNFSQDRKKWETYPATPRYGVQYFSLRGTLGVLSESYSYAPFKDRVKASRAFVQALFEYVAAKKDEVRKLVEPGTSAETTIALRTETVPLTTRKILGFEGETKGGKGAATDKPKEYTLDYIAKVKPTEVVSRPQGGYFIPAEFSKAVDTLRRHGITVQKLSEDTELEVEVYQLEAVDIAARAFQQQRAVTTEVKKRTEKRKVPAATIFVNTNQPLGTLAAYLLEPRCEDGLTTWGFFTDKLKKGEDFPVLRLPKAVPLKLGELVPLK